MTELCSSSSRRSRSTTRPRTSSTQRWGADVVDETWRSDPLFYPAKPPADWLMVAEVGGRVLMVPLAKPSADDPRQCRPIGCYEASRLLADQYRKDRSE